jgi:hypothetical protein
LYALENVITVIKLRIGGTCRTHGRVRKNITKFLSENLKGKYHAEDVGVDGKIILKWIFLK